MVHPSGINHVSKVQIMDQEFGFQVETITCTRNTNAGYNNNLHMNYGYKNADQEFRK